MHKVFINCPFDDEYFPFLKVILFTVKKCGFSPLIAQTKDSGKARINKLVEMIKEASLSIHDISRLELNEKGLPRLNMALELGLDLGIKECKPYTHKKLVIIEKEKYRYKEVLSDLAGNDIYIYDNEPETLAKQLRNWLFHHNSNIKHYNEIWEKYQEFDLYYEETLLANKLHPNKIGEIPFSEIIKMMEDWVTL